MIYYFSQLSFLQICNKFIGLYAHVHGLVKVKEIFSKSVESKQVIDIYKQSFEHDLQINFAVISSTLHSIPFFIFAKGETLALGSVFMLFKWHERINSERIFNQMTEDDLKSIVLSILENAEFWFSSKFKNNLHALKDI